MSGAINSGDIIYLVNFVFKGGMAPMPIPEAGEVIHDLQRTSAEIIYLSGPDTELPRRRLQKRPDSS